MVELRYGSPQDESEESFECGIPTPSFIIVVPLSLFLLLTMTLKLFRNITKGQNIDLMLIHLGGTTIPSPSQPLLMVTMDAKQGIELVKLICSDLTIPIHYE